MSEKRRNSKIIFGIIAGAFGLIIGIIALIACLVRGNYQITFVGIVLIVVSLIDLIANCIFLRNIKRNKVDE